MHKLVEIRIVRVDIFGGATGLESSFYEAVVLL